jgi:nucleotide-binding universal stress UspA family protein
MESSFQSIVHPTDFSELSSKAFAHALRIALAAKGRLHLLHVDQPGEEATGAFPQVRSALAQWGLIVGEELSSAIGDKLGIVVSNDRIGEREAVRGIRSYLDQHPVDLVVLGTHGRDGIERLVKGSIAEEVFQHSPIPTLFVSGASRGFVSEVSGDITLRRVLVPVDHKPAPARAVEAIRRFAHAFTGIDVATHLLHVGTAAPVVFSGSRELEFAEPVIVRSGGVVDAILRAADEFEVDLIGMPTAGHHGIFDAVRGSTTERVLRHAPCPVLAVPA